MTQYNSLNVKLSNSQLNILKPAIKNENEVVLRLSSNMVGNSTGMYPDDETNFPHKLLLTDKLQIFLKLLQIIYQLILSYQKLDYLRWCNLEDFLVDFLVHYKRHSIRINCCSS